MSEEQKREDLFSDDNKIAEEYDLLKMAVPHHDEFQEQVGIELLKKFDADSSIKILEIGSGTGLTTSEIVKALPNAEITALDLEAGMQEQAKSKGISDNIEYIASDALEYLSNLEDGAYEAVVTAYTLHNFKHEYRNKLITQIGRVVKSGGLLINADKIAHDDEQEYRAAYDEQIKKYDVYDSIGKTDLKNEWVEHYAVDDSEEIRLIEGEFIQKLEEAGFVNAQLTWRTLLEAVIVAQKS